MTEGALEIFEWSPDGKLLAVGTRGRRDGSAMISKLQIWNAATGEPVHTLNEQRKRIRLLAWNPDGSTLASADDSGSIKIWNARTGGLRHALVDSAGNIKSLRWSNDGYGLVATSDDGAIRLWALDQGDPPRALTLVSGQDFWSIVSADGFFMGTQDAPLSLVRGNTSFSAAQLAPARNRPDRVLAALGAPPERVELYRSLWKHRLKRMGLDEEQLSTDFSAAPAARIVSVGAVDMKGQTSIELVFTDETSLQSYQVFVNGVPVNKKYARIQGKRQRLSISVQLTKGENLIEATALNTQGIESLRAAHTIQHDGRGLPAPRLFFLGFGVSGYVDEEITDLRFAHKDVGDLARAFTDAGKRFQSVRTRTFTNAQVSKAAIEKARQFVAGITEHDTLVMFIAGHGVRGHDAARTYYYLMHRTRVSDLATTAMPFETIEALLYEAKARKKLFLIDTCESGEDLDLVMAAQAGGEPGLSARSIRGMRRRRKKAPPPATTVSADGATSAAWRQSVLSALRDRDRWIMQDLSRRSGRLSWRLLWERSHPTKASNGRTERSRKRFSVPSRRKLPTATETGRLTPMSSRPT